MMQTLYTRDNLKPSLWIISVQRTENSISQRLHGYCFYLQLLSSDQHKLIISRDSKVCSQRCNKWIISSKSLLMLCVNNQQFNYYSILSDCCCCCLVTSVMSDSVQPHRWQPTRLRHPWDSPGRVLEWVTISFSTIHSYNSWAEGNSVDNDSLVKLFLTISPYCIYYKTSIFLLLFI